MTATPRETPQQDRAAPQPTTLFEAVQMEPLYPGAGAGITLTGPEVTRMLDYRSRILAIVGEAAAPGAAALDRIAELEAVLRRAARDLHNIAYGLHDPTDFEHCRNVRCIDFRRLLGARAAEPKPPESGE